MLILTREVGEAIEIDGGRIKIFVTSLRNGRVRLGIQADRAIEVDREEVAQAKRQWQAARKSG